MFVKYVIPGFFVVLLVSTGYMAYIGYALGYLDYLVIGFVSYIYLRHNWWPLYQKQKRYGRTNQTHTG